MEVEPENPIQEALQQQESLYNEIMNQFYSPLQYALGRQNNQALQNLRGQWTSGNPPEQDRFAMAIQSLRDTVEQHRGQEDVSELEKRVQQLESMHQEITNDLGEQQVNEPMNQVANGGRRTRRRGNKHRRTKRRKTKRSRQ
jgi:hypothetical protein